MSAVAELVAAAYAVVDEWREVAHPPIHDDGPDDDFGDLERAIVQLDAALTAVASWRGSVGQAVRDHGPLALGLNDPAAPLSATLPAEPAPAGTTAPEKPSQRERARREPRTCKGTTVDGDRCSRRRPKTATEPDWRCRDHQLGACGLLVADCHRGVPPRPASDSDLARVLG